MLTLLEKWFIPNNDNTQSPTVRHAYGVLCSVMGICFNILLFTLKLFAGFISNSIAIMADAVNNLSDALSSVITIIGTKLAGRKPDKKHPLGHGRTEYLSAMIVAAIVAIPILLALIIYVMRRTGRRKKEPAVDGRAALEEAMKPKGEE